MGDHGYHYTDLDQPRRKAWPGQRPGAEELATATQDASCKTKVGLTQYGDLLIAGMVSAGLSSTHVGSPRSPST